MSATLEALNDQLQELLQQRLELEDEIREIEEAVAALLAPRPVSALPVLPEIRPTTRGFKMDEWPQSITKSRNGRTVRRVQVSVPAGATTDLVWENITYTQAESLVIALDASYGSYSKLELADATLAGLSNVVGSNLFDLVKEPFPGAVWRAAGPPRVEAVKHGRCTVALPLKTRNDISLLTTAD